MNSPSPAGFHALRQTVAGFLAGRKLSQGQGAPMKLNHSRPIFRAMSEQSPVGEPAEISLKTAALRGLMGRCPHCGQGKLMRGYLKQVEACAVCGEQFGHIRADDAAPWLTIIVVGHIFLPFAFMVNVDWMPTWAVMLMWSAFFAAIALAILPRAKALFIGVLWQTRAPGYKPVEIVKSV